MGRLSLNPVMIPCMSSKANQSCPSVCNNIGVESSSLGRGYTQAQKEGQANDMVPAIR